MIINDEGVKQHVQENIKKIIEESVINIFDLTESEAGDKKANLVLVNLKNGMVFSNVSYIPDQQQAINETINVIATKLYDYEYYRTVQNMYEAAVQDSE